MDPKRFQARGRRVSLTVALIVAAALPAGSAAFAADTAAPTATGPAAVADEVAARAGWIVYQRSPHVRVVRVDGTGDRIVTPVPAGNQQHPDWSPDGSRIAFDVDDSAIWVVGFHGERPRQVYTCTAPCLWVSEPAWSPDGTEIAFTRYSVKADGRTARRSVVAAVGVRSGKVRVLHRVRRGSDIPFTPRWSPDGRRIVFEEDRFVDDDKDTSDTVG